MCALLGVVISAADAHALLSAQLQRLELVVVPLTSAVDEVAALARRPVEAVPHELPLARTDLAVELAVRRPLKLLRRDRRRGRRGHH